MPHHPWILNTERICIFHKYTLLDNHSTVIKIGKITLMSICPNNNLFIANGFCSEPCVALIVMCLWSLSFCFILEQFLNIWLSWPWRFWRLQASYFVDCPSSWYVSLWLDSCHAFLEEISQNWSCVLLFAPSCQVVCDFHLSIIGDVHMMKVGPVRLLYCAVILFTL